MRGRISLDRSERGTPRNEYSKLGGQSPKPGPGKLDHRLFITRMLPTSAQPQINRSFHFGLEGKVHLLPRPRGLIRGVHDFGARRGIFAGDERLFFLLDRIR